jgi:hypothetical protein
MATILSWRAPVAITASTWLRQELGLCEQHAGCEFAYAGCIPDGRKNARRRPMVIIGADLVSRVRKPILCAGLVVVATLEPADTRAFVHADRIGAPYVIALPTARPWLADRILHPPAA